MEEKPVASSSIYQVSVPSLINGLVGGSSHWSTAVITGDGFQQQLKERFQTINSSSQNGPDEGFNGHISSEILGSSGFVPKVIYQRRNISKAQTSSPTKTEVSGGEL